ncbi:MAG TPA: Crp/Fnr family transcriptional regulator, partial [Chitinophagaceae bacterium]|nr:Crp/Fnr family transcriptional regulator [Chitinophagaceae bacterium]
MSQLLRSQIEDIVPLTDAEFELVVSAFTEKKFRRHQFMVQEENSVPYLYFIVRGLIKSFVVEDDGREHILDLNMDNNWTTDMQAFHLKQKATMNIYCIEDCETLAIGQDNLEKLCSQLDKMQYFFRRKAIEQNIHLQRRIRCFISSTAANRYHELVTKNPGLIQRVPKKLIASYLGVSRETLSRLLLQ